MIVCWCIIPSSVRLLQHSFISFSLAFHFARYVFLFFSSIRKCLQAEMFEAIFWKLNWAKRKIWCLFIVRIIDHLNRVNSFMCTSITTIFNGVYEALFFLLRVVNAFPRYNTIPVKEKLWKVPIFLIPFPPDRWGGDKNASDKTH